jgi:hypothetical protein
MCSECFHTRDGGIFEILTTAIGTLFDRRRPEGGSVSKFALVSKLVKFGAGILKQDLLFLKFF